MVCPHTPRGAPSRLGGPDDHWIRSILHRLLIGRRFNIAEDPPACPMSFPQSRAARGGAISRGRCWCGGGRQRKTRVITRRLRIFSRAAMTRSNRGDHVTNKAAREMRERAGGCWRRRARALAADVTISTFHALGLKIIRGVRRVRPQTGSRSRPGTSSRSSRLCRRPTAPARALQWRISAWKNALRRRLPRERARCETMRRTRSIAVRRHAAAYRPWTSTI